MIPRFASDPPTASTDSWVSRRAPSVAYDQVCRDLERQALRTARAMVKRRARFFALHPRQLDVVYDGLSTLFPGEIVEVLTSVVLPPPTHWFGFGGEVQMINFKAVLLYARWSRMVAARMKKQKALRWPD